MWKHYSESHGDIHSAGLRTGRRTTARIRLVARQTPVAALSQQLRFHYSRFGKLKQYFYKIFRKVRLQFAGVALER